MDRFLDKHSKGCYATSHLEGDGLEVIICHTNDSEEPTITFHAAFIETLKTYFGNPVPICTARRAHSTLKQGKGDFATYLIQFSRLISKLKYHEAAKRGALEPGLAVDLKNSMSNIRKIHLPARETWPS